jgi:hypothetical protein
MALFVSPIHRICKAHCLPRQRTNHQHISGMQRSESWCPPHVLERIYSLIDLWRQKKMLFCFLDTCDTENCS